MMEVQLVLFRAMHDGDASAARCFSPGPDSLPSGPRASTEVDSHYLLHHLFLKCFMGFSYECELLFRVLVFGFGTPFFELLTLDF